ncbi:MAG: MmcQ/YjbR family DNA-binding protein [Brumimicrobium sp.]|nr:MmcQ/YjbR family DNA-binding protein [Brumimicrobium sp.]
MDTLLFREYCLSKAHTSESLPFDDETLVFKLNGKMFALLDLDKGQSCNLKCDPERAIELRERFDGIIPGYHMNKMHWNTVFFDRDVNDKLICELIDHSYDLIMKNFSAKIRKELLGGSSD